MTFRNVKAIVAFNSQKEITATRIRIIYEDQASSLLLEGKEKQNLKVISVNVCSRDARKKFWGVQSMQQNFGMSSSDFHSSSADYFLFAVSNLDGFVTDDIIRKYQFVLTGKVVRQPGVKITVVTFCPSRLSNIRNVGHAS